MEFDSTHKVIPETMNVTQARAFIDFLEYESSRHYRDILEYEDVVEERRSQLTYDTESQVYIDAFRRFCESAVERHNEDIGLVEKLIPEVKEMHHL